MPRPVSLFTGQWADLPLETLAGKAAAFGYDGLELACWGDHFDPRAAAEDDDYCKQRWELLTRQGLGCWAISNHLVGQAVCDPVDSRHRGILPEHIWGDGDPDGVRARAAQEMIVTGRAARRFFDHAPDEVKAALAASGRTVVVGFTGSPVWHAAYAFPPLPAGALEQGFADFAAAWTPILDDYVAHGVSFALEVHPTEIAFDISSARRALAALSEHPAFGFNFDPSHFGYQGVDYLAFLREFGGRLLNVHIKDVWWSERPAEAGVFGGHTDFGADGRYWDFRSPGRGRIDFEGIVRLLNHLGYQGPLSVEWEDPMMDREHGASEAAAFVRKLDFPRSDVAFDAAFER
ncbi:MAG: sugar phosphate isomerase/epimerase [Planctomycetota bacterium]|nr:MAG: sugar phosphate isomerase/epimerase [Planctomycetota bacterium]